MKLFNNFFFHAAILGVCALAMILDVVLTGANFFREFSGYAKVAGVIFVVDLVVYVGYTMGIALFGKK